MVQTFLGFEVIEHRLRHLRNLGVKDLEFKIEDTPECIAKLKKAFHSEKDSVEVFIDIAMVCFWYGDADGIQIHILLLKMEKSKFIIGMR